MKAKQRFYALGQSAKMRGVNRYNALKTYHMAGAPKWARNAFLAGWEDAHTEHEITYQFHELSDRAKDKVREWLAPDHEWWDSAYETIDEASEDFGIKLDRMTWERPRRSVQRLVMYFDFDGCNAQVQFNADIYIETVTANWDNALHKAVGIDMLREGAIGRIAYIKDAKVGEIITSYHDYKMESGPLAGASIADLHDVLDTQGYYTALEAFLQEKADAFKAYAEKVLEDEYEYLTSDEYIADTCEANEYRFDEDGNHL